MDIEVIRLGPGARPPETADWISIEPVEGGRYNVAGSVGGEWSLVFAGEIFESAEEAALAGIFWARHRGSRTVYIEHLA
mgnify:CR=1 FL=1